MPAIQHQPDYLSALCLDYNSHAPHVLLIKTTFMSNVDLQSSTKLLVFQH